MIYFYRRTSLKHLGFITRFEKKKRTTSWHSVGSTFEVPAKFRAIFFTLLIIQWKSTEQICSFLSFSFIHLFIYLFFFSFALWSSIPHLHLGSCQDKYSQMLATEKLGQPDWWICDHNKAPHLASIAAACASWPDALDHFLHTFIH